MKQLFSMDQRSPVLFPAHDRRKRDRSGARAPVKHLALPGHEIRRGQPKRRETIAGFLDRMSWKFALPTICVINGKPVMRKKWKRLRIRALDEVIFLSRPLGGDSASTAKSIGGIIAIIALAAFAPWAGGALASAFSMGSIGAAAFTAGITVAGGLLINSLKEENECPQST